MLDSRSDTTFAAYQNIIHELTDDIYLLMKPNGAIIESNGVARSSVLMGNTSNFYELFLTEDKPNVYQFIQQVTSRKPYQKIFIHFLKNKMVTVQYRGKLTNSNIVLLGKVLKDQKEVTNNLEVDYQEQYEKEQDFRKFMFHELEIGILTINSMNKIDCCNERMKLFVELDSIEQLVGKDLIHLEHKHPLLHNMKQMTKEIRDTKMVKERFYYEGDCLYQVKGMYFKSDESIRFVLYDRSHQQRFENLLMYKKQMESVSHLAAGVAHELRNPLSVIQGFIQLSSVTNDFSKYYDTVLSELSRMNEIIEDFLSVSRKKMAKQKQRPDLIIKSLVHIIQSECLLHNLLFEYDLEESNQYALVNESMIKQVILNLLRNSIEAYGEGKDNRYIYLKGSQQNNMYEVVFEDHGPGMPQEILDQLGKPFFTTKEKGTGIGIPLCKKIIEEHQGSFHIISTLGKGTETTFQIPFLTEKNKISTVGEGK